MRGDFQAVGSGEDLSMPGRDDRLNPVHGRARLGRSRRLGPKTFGVAASREGPRCLNQNQLAELFATSRHQFPIHLAD